MEIIDTNQNDKQIIKETFGFTEDETNSYKLLIYFPENYKNIKYQDVIEGIEVQVNSSQIIED